MVNDVIIFLAEEGFLRYDKDPNCNEGNFWRTRLTLKGFTILGALPQTLSTAKEKSLFERAQESLNSVTGTAGAEAGKQVVAEIFKLALVGAS